MVAFIIGCVVIFIACLAGIVYLAEHDRDSRWGP